MTEIKETIKYRPWLGELEPITEVLAAEVKLYTSHLEVIKSYTYEPFMPDEDTSGYTKSATMIPKHQVVIELTESWHERDIKKTTHPTVRILYLDQGEIIHVQTEKEAHEIYSRIKKWMLE